ncbi:MAG: hypothetical protein AAB289_08790 [Chloroflexota bacterium]
MKPDVFRRIGRLLQGGGEADPYWNDFIRRKPADPLNLLGRRLRDAPTGLVHTNKTEVHDPLAMTGHLRELSRFFGADMLGVAATTAGLLAPLEGLAPPEEGEPPYSAERWAADFPSAVVALIGWEYDPERDLGIGGQWGDLKTAVIAFNLAAYTRELGYRAIATGLQSVRLAAAANLGSVDSAGRITVAGFGTNVWLANAVLTNLPLAPGGAASQGTG